MNIKTSLIIGGSGLALAFGSMLFSGSASSFSELNLVGKIGASIATAVIAYWVVVSFVSAFRK